MLYIEDRATDKTSNTIAEAVALSMITVIERYKDKEKTEIKIKEEDEADKWRSFLPHMPRRHSASSSQILGATALPLPILRPRGRFIPDVMDSAFSFTTHFPNPPPAQPAQSLPGLWAQARADSHRSNTSEQKKVLEVVTSTFSAPSQRSDGSNAEMEGARGKLQDMLNSLASDQTFANIDLGSLLNNTSWKVKAKEAEY